jgi:hypothetical protein
VDGARSTYERQGVSTGSPDRAHARNPHVSAEILEVGAITCLRTMPLSNMVFLMALRRMKLRLPPTVFSRRSGIGLPSKPASRGRSAKWP